MAISATFWTFAKRKNSTLKPGAAGADFNISIKYPCTIENPTIEIHAGEVWAYNYCYIPFWGRYYFIDSHTSIAAGTYELRLSVDTAATYKEQITGQTVYGVYSSGDYDVLLNDPRIVPENVEVYKVEENIGAIFTASTIFDYAMVITEDGNLNGVDVYAGGGVLNSMLHAIANPANLQQLVNAIGGADPFRAVLDAWRSPLVPSGCFTDVEGHTGNVWGFTVSGERVTNYRLRTHAVKLEINHSRETNDFRDEWTRYILYMPFGGTCELDNHLMRLGEYIDIRYCADPISGMIAFNAFIHRKDSALDYPVASWGTQLKTSIPIFSQRSPDFIAAMNAAKGITSIIGAGVKGAAQGGAAGAVVSGVSEAAGQYAGAYFDSITQPPGYFASQFAGSEAPFWALTGNRYFRYYELRYSSKNAPSINNALKGRPVQKPVTIGAAGYIQSTGASVAIPGTDAERATLNALLDGGLYYE